MEAGIGNFLEMFFKIKLSGKKIDKHLIKINYYKKIDKKKDIAAVACVQRSIKKVKSVEEYIDILHRFVKEAKEAGCDFIVFPEYNFLDLYGIIPFSDKIRTLFSKNTTNENSKCEAQTFDKEMYHPNLEKTAENKELSPSKGEDKTIFNILYAISFPIQSALEHIMCSLSAKYDIYIYTGTYLLREEGKLYNCGSLISRDGKILGRQKKLHLTDFEEDMNLSRGDKLNYFDTDIGRIACPICMDATYFETFKIARNLGCDIVALPIANNEEYNFYRALRGIWPRVQESYVYGLKSSLNGNIAGIKFTGKSGIFAPAPLTEKGDGIVNISKNYEGDSLIIGCIDIKRLKAQRLEAEYYGDVNENFERDYYLKTYKGSEKNEK
ncbi:Predicted amidohydrolase [Caloramator quimbayensis]|uniref:Predicted amidohydrolase n=1 Tax=Caloramator quimbayensis TaxID=1147123 RepID=A0A1T4WJZ2_9CLOT|nr:nitrilase-related carbon-nitrogen hydrolase [Caloramator quimbayensis]SKA77499.1 Predicted amidohydrolase [Caloramator quimbayensis]